ncbi:hypothetical protein [Desulfobacula sp.]|uniref:hypothetical protein n=1 Tax=Desulfobacula sp. TaxID=2593537 RepID=UPI0026088DEE|nr:hypothetical protein [Desulfobacula sp.]
MFDDKSYLYKHTEMPKGKSSARLHVTKAIERLEWRDNKTQYVKIDGDRLKEFYDEYVELETKLKKIRDIFGDTQS